MSIVYDPRSKDGALAVRRDLGTLVVTGKDRRTWLNGLVTCDLAPLAPGSAAYGLAVSKVGRILADVIVVATEDRLLLGVPKDRAEALRAAFDTYLVMEDAELSLATDETSWWLLHGPASASIARSVAEELDGVAAPVDLTGTGGAALVLSSSKSELAEGALRSAGAVVGDEESWTTLRLERAIPAWGIDFDDKTYPQEASLEKRAVSFQKGCYLGQEVVCRLEMRGHVHRKLVALVLDGGNVPPRGAVVTSDDGTTVGHVTSAGASANVGGAIALAMVKHASAEPGVHLSVDGAAARVVDVPVS